MNWFVIALAIAVPVVIAAVSVFVIWYNSGSYDPPGSGGD